MRAAAHQGGVPDDLLAEAMIVEGWMLLTGSTEAEARQEIATILNGQLAALRNVDV